MRMLGAILLAALCLLPLYAQDWTKESKDRTKRAALHDDFQIVRGDSGQWNDDAQLLHTPSPEKRPPKTALDAWAERFARKKPELTDKDEHWLIFRSAQLDDNDRVWIERIERRGTQFTILANFAKWQGKYFRNFTYYPVLAIKLGSLEAGKYDVKWVLRPHTFTKFDGDGKAVEANWPLDERPVPNAAPTELRLTFAVGKS